MRISTKPHSYENNLLHSTGGAFQTAGGETSGGATEAILAVAPVSHAITISAAFGFPILRPEVRGCAFIARPPRLDARGGGGYCHLVRGASRRRLPAESFAVQMTR